MKKYDDCPNCEDCIMQCENCEKLGCPTCEDWKTDSEGIDLCPECYEALMDDIRRYPEEYKTDKE